MFSVLITTSISSFKLKTTFSVFASSLPYLILVHPITDQSLSPLVSLITAQRGTPQFLTCSNWLAHCLSLSSLQLGPQTPVSIDYTVFTILNKSQWYLVPVPVGQDLFGHNACHMICTLFQIHWCTKVISITIIVCFSSKLTLGHCLALSRHCLSHNGNPMMPQTSLLT